MMRGLIAATDRMRAACPSGSAYRAVGVLAFRAGPVGDTTLVLLVVESEAEDRGAGPFDLRQVSGGTASWPPVHGTRTSLTASPAAACNPSACSRHGTEW